MKSKLKFLLSLALLLLFIPILNPLSASAAELGNTGNNSFTTALGLSKYSNPGTTILEPNYNEAYYKYKAMPGDKVYVSFFYDKKYGNMTVSLHDQNYKEIDKSSQVMGLNTSSPFIYIKADAKTSSDVFYVKVTRDPKYTGTMYFSPSVVYDRIKTGSKEVEFKGTAAVGNGPIDLQGRDSSVITADLTQDTSIPKGAIVKNITTKGNQAPSQGNVVHKIMSNENQVWHTAAVAGCFKISLQDNLQVAKVWNFKYHVGSPAGSTMKNVTANIGYEYDETESFK